MNKKKFFLALSLVLTIALLFWSQSRLPQLNEKAQMAERVNISAIAFDIIYPVNIDDNYGLRVAKTATNWAYTNWKGMSFGLAFAAAFLTLLLLLPAWRPSKNPILNSLKGIVMGVPLSVCVNCSTPIAYGMHRANLNIVTVLATLMSSPTLNIIVVTMAFSLLPFHLALIKVLSALFFIVFIIPLIVRFTGTIKIDDTEINQSIDDIKQKSVFSLFSSNTDNNGGSCALPNAAPVRPDTWLLACKEVGGSFITNFVFIIKMTLPLMLLAGVLGAMLIEAVSFNQLNLLETGLLALLVVAIIGTILPVPIAFDIIVVTTLIAVGLPTGLAMTLLFSLSIFSIYPALIIAQKISVKLSIVLFVSTMLAAMLVGVISQAIDDHVRVTTSNELANEFTKGKNKAMFEVAVAECTELSNESAQNQCFAEFIAGDYAKNIKAEECDRLIVNNEALQASCRNTIIYQQTLKLALDKRDIKLCLNLTYAKYQGKCWQAYATHRAIDTNAIEWCDDFADPKGKKQCRVNVMLFRVARMQSTDACNVTLSRPEKKDCLQHLQSMVTSLSGDLASCQQLEHRLQVKSCQKNMYQREIDNELNYGFCQQISDHNMKEQCDDYAHFVKAKKQGDKNVCQDVNNGSVKQRCIVSAQRAKVELQLANTGVLFGEEIKSLSNSSLNSSSQAAQQETLVANNKAVNTQRSLQGIPTPSLQWHKFMSDGAVAIDYISHKPKQSLSDSKFAVVPGKERGLHSDKIFNFNDFIEPFNYGRGMASGDFNNDQWPDMVFATSNGAAIFQNLGNGNFQQHTIERTSDKILNSLVVAFVDINNDGWQDVFLTTYGGDNYFFINQNGQFTEESHWLETQEDRVVTMAAGFADWDKDGDLDYVAGNWSYGNIGSFNPQYSHNHWLTNTGDAFSVQTASALQGDTLSILLSDFNQDDHVDLMVGNDREYPDQYYLTTKNQPKWQKSNHRDVIPGSSLNTMGIETADFNNDLLLDLFSTDMSFSTGSDKHYCDLLLDKTEQARCHDLLAGYESILNYDVAGCIQMSDANDKQSCLVAMAIQLANRDSNVSYCEQIPPSYASQRKLCTNLASRGKDKPMIAQQDHIPQQQNNVLLMRQADGSLIDQAHAMGVDKSFWSWNAKAADIDNDEWQDIYVGNGYEFGTTNNEVHSNVFFHNQAGKKFVQAQASFGLEDYTNTTNYTYSDIDLDGDIDIIANGAMARPRIYFNQSNDNNSISFILRDDIGNKFCINCKVTIHYGDDKHQIREIKLGGGFQSFDDPVIYFGLSRYEHIDKVEITWSTGEKTVLNKPMPVNRRYRISRAE